MILAGCHCRNRAFCKWYQAEAEKNAGKDYRLMMLVERVYGCLIHINADQSLKANHQLCQTSRHQRATQSDAFEAKAEKNRNLAALNNRTNKKRPPVSLSVLCIVQPGGTIRAIPSVDMGADLPPQYDGLFYARFSKRQPLCNQQAMSRKGFNNNWKRPKPKFSAFISNIGKRRDYQ